MADNYYSIIIKMTFDYEVICCCIDCGQGDELDGLDERAKLAGWIFKFQSFVADVP